MNIYKYRLINLILLLLISTAGISQTIGSPNSTLTVLGKLKVNKADTLTTPPTFVWVSKGDTVAKYRLDSLLSSGAHSLTMQQTFNNSVTATNNPIIDANGNVFNIEDANNVLLYSTPHAPNNSASGELVSRDAGFQRYGGFTSSYSAFGGDTSISADVFAINQLTQIGNTFQVRGTSVTLNQFWGGINADNTIQKFAHPPPIAGQTYYIPVSVNGNVADAAGNITIDAGGGEGGSFFTLDTTLTADGSFVYNFDFPAQPQVYNDLPNLDSVTWATNIISFHFSEAPANPEQLHFQAVSGGGSGGGGGGGGECVGCITQLQLNDSMDVIRNYVDATFATQQALEDSASDIRDDMPTGGGGSDGTTDFSLTGNNSGSGAASGSTFNGSSALTWSYNTFGAVPTTRTVSTTGPLTGGGALTGNLNLSIPEANGSTNGYLSATTFNAFMGKVDQGSIFSSGLQATSGILLGRYSAGTGAVQPITIGANLSLSGAGVLSATGGGGGGGTTDFPLTFATTGGAAPGTDFNGGATIILSPTSIGAVSTAFTLSTTAPLTGGGNFTTNRTIGMTQATTSTNGYVTATKYNDWEAKVSPGAITSSGLTMTSARILGRWTAGTGAPQEVTIGTGLNLSGSGVLTATGGAGGAALGLEYYETYTALSNTAPVDIDYNDGGNFTITLTANRTLNFQNAKIGVPIYITVTQDGTGNRFLTFPNNTKFVFGISDPGSHILNLSSGAGQVDIICVVKDPTNFNVWMAKDMRF